jgi:AAA domain
VNYQFNDEAEAERQRQEYDRAKPNGAADIRFQFTQFRDIKIGTKPPYTIDEILPRIGVVVIWGAPKCGKTFWAFDVEMHVALGWTYRGRRVEQGKVLHIACEGVAGIGARKEAWRLHHINGKDAETIAQIDAAPFHLCKETALDLIGDVDQVVGDIVLQFGDQLIKIITIDTLNRSLRGSESRDEDMAAYIKAAVLLAEKFQCLVIVVHHCGYDRSHPRGHTSLIGAVDGDILAEKDASNNVCTEVKNMRDGANGAQTCSRLEVVEVGRDDNGEPITSCVIVEAASGQDAKRLRPKLSPHLQITLDILRDTLARHGELPPAEKPDIPPYASVVTTSLWQVTYLAKTSSDGKDIDTRKREWRRYRNELISRKIVCADGELVWMS